MLYVPWCSLFRGPDRWDLGRSSKKNVLRPGIGTDKIRGEGVHDDVDALSDAANKRMGPTSETVRDDAAAAQKARQTPVAGADANANFPSAAEPEETTTKPHDCSGIYEHREASSSDEAQPIEAPEPNLHAPNGLRFKKNGVPSDDSDEDATSAWQLRQQREAHTSKSNISTLSDDSEDENVFEKSTPRGTDSMNEAKQPPPRPSGTPPIHATRFVKEAAERIDFSTRSPRGKFDRVSLAKASRNDQVYEKESSDDDINTLIDKELNKRIAAIASGSRNFRGTNVSVDRGQSNQEDAQQMHDNSASDSASDRAPDWISDAKNSNSTTSHVSASLQNLLAKIQTSSVDPGGFNDIMKDAIQEKLRRQEMAHEHTLTSISKRRTTQKSSASTVVLSNGVVRPLMNVTSDYLFDEQRGIPGISSSPDSSSSPNPRINRRHKGQSIPFAAKRGIFEGRAFRSGQNFDHSSKQEHVQLPKHRLQETRRLKRYFDSRSKRREYASFLALWYT